MKLALILSFAAIAAFAAAPGLNAADFRWMPGIEHCTALVALPGMLEGMTEILRDENSPRGGADSVSGDAAAIRAFFGGLQQVLNWRPAAGRRIRIGGEWSATSEDGERSSGTFELLKGAGECFRLAFAGRDLPIHLPDSGVAVGHDSRLWMTAADGGCFMADSTDGNLSGRIPAGVAVYRRALAGFAGMAALSGNLGTLNSIIRFEAGRDADGVTLTARQKRDLIELKLSSEGALLREVNVSSSGKGRVRIVFTIWEPDAAAVDGDFSPPPGLSGKDVPAAELASAVAAVVNTIFTEAGIK